MRIIRDRRIVSDHWLHVPEAEPVDEAPAAGDVIVTLEYWQAHKVELLTRGTGVGVRLGAAERVEELADDLQHLDLVALEFAAFTEGRGYSQARLLRDRYRYGGEIRAVGDVSRDRLHFMERCGINAYELREDGDLENALKAFAEISDAYQPALDDRPIVPMRRGWRAA